MYVCPLIGHKTMLIRLAFAKSLREIRKAKLLTQEDFATISSRTYISSLERGEKSPTLEKIDSLAKGMKVHPLTLLALAYVKAGGYKDVEELCKKVRSELTSIKVV